MKVKRLSLVFQTLRFIDYKNEEESVKRVDVVKIFLIIIILIPSFSLTHSYADVSVGDLYEGGTVFCVSQIPDITKCVTKGSGKYGLIMANEDQVNFDSNPEHGVTWTRANNAVPDARLEDDGAANTYAIIKALPEDNPNNNAAWLCHNYRGGEKEDWYLPSKNELNKMYLFAKANSLIGRNCVGSKPKGVRCLIGGDREAYWSSTESLSGYPWRQYFRSDGFQYSKAWDDDPYLGVRAVRNFIASTVQPLNNLSPAQIQQAVGRFIHDAEEVSSVDITKLQEMLQGALNAETLLPIFNWLKTNHTIKLLNLANVDLRELIVPLSDLLTVRTDFTVINLINCNLEAAGIRRLFLQRHSGELTALYLGLNNIGEEGAGLLVEVLQNNPALTIFDVGANQIGDRGAVALAEVLLRGNTTLMTVNLENNRISLKGLTTLMNVLQNNGRLAVLYFGWNDIAARYLGYCEGAQILIETLRDNPALIVYDIQINQLCEETERTINEIYGKKILLKLLRKIKRASSFTFMMGIRHNLIQHILSHILEYVGLNVHNRAEFEDARDYNTEENRRIIFNGSLEEVIRLFYYGNHADYADTIREINQLRQQQREFLQRHGQEIPAGQLLELPEDLPGIGGFALTPERIAATFWPAT